MLNTGLGLLKNGQSVSEIISGVRTGEKFIGLFFCLLSGIILLEFILGLVSRLVM